MLKKNLVLGMMLIMLLAMSTSVMAQPAPNVPASGDGSPADPYQIETINNIVWITQNTVEWSKHYIQIVNIDASTTPTWDSGAGFSPIGNNTTKFTGSYNGQNKTIDGLFINRAGTNYNGFFGYTYGATVQNLGLTNVNITGHEYTGGLIGRTYSSCTVSNCYTTGSVTGTNYDTGGLVGQNNGSAISNSYSTATVIGVINTGGLVGKNQNGGTISNCYSTGSVTVIYNYHAGNSVGGLIGCHENEGNTSTVSNCYSRGDVTRSAGGNNNYGSFIGANGGATVENCYSTGSVYYTVGDDPTDKGFFGYYNGGTFTDNFWDSDVSNQATGTGATAKTTPLMKRQSTFTSWDFNVDGVSAGHNGVWIMAGYPHLQMEWSATVSNLVESQMVVLDVDESYTQSVNIDASTTSTWNYNGTTYDGFSPIGNVTIKFTGSYDGQGHTIDGLIINRSGTYYIGFFGYTSGTTIQNIGVTNVNITGNHYVGGLVGYNDNTSPVSNSYSTGSVSGTENVGGLVGCNYTSSPVSNSYSTGSVSGNTSVGGLLGYNSSSTVSKSYSTGSVSGTTQVGGLVGHNPSSTVSNSFYNSGTSGQSDNTGKGVPKTTAEMTTDALIYNYTSNIYLHGGWDFKGESTNGTVDIWNIGNSRNDGYPYLDWQYPEDTSTLPVTLSTFTAQYIENTPTLYWETQSELDNMGWFVYRNIEEDFTTSEKISKFIEGHGTTTQQQSYIYEDRIQNPEVGDTYYYWLESIDFSGMVNHYDKVAVMQIPDIHNPDPHVAVPSKYGLQSGPNPFNSNLSVSYMLPQTDMVRIEIYNMHGQLIAQFNEGLKTADKKYTLEWDGKDIYGQDVSSGVLLIKLITSEGSETKKAILLR